MKYFYEQISKKDGIILRGVINTPDDFDASKKYPAVIFYHGFGGDRNGSAWFRGQNSQYLTDRGYITVRFDFSGTNESDGDFYNMTVSREEEEAVMIYDFTRLRKFVDRNRIYLVGHSLGGVISTLIAPKINPKAMVLLAPASDMNNPDYLKIAGMTYFDPKTDRGNLEKLEIAKKVREIEDVDIGGVKLHKNFLIDFLPKDIYGQARKYRGNVLILRGTQDDLVYNDANQKLEKAYPHAKYEQIIGADHSFTNFDHRQIIFEKMYNFLEENK
ncbi:S9 family peptidase [uncultured Anaerococcus sp.]|uniref:alpha/beta hydrolase family protein n=1 Tax=uncultured Anaerococcus sp. TaxID=293428 RepID=UPI0025D80224|nr:alpha/beta fold hydrolase [uncultured Anaerococcus sp.]